MLVHTSTAGTIESSTPTRSQQVASGLPDHKKKTISQQIWKITKPYAYFQVVSTLWQNDGHVYLVPLCYSSCGIKVGKYNLRIPWGSQYKFILAMCFDYGNREYYM